MTLLVDECCAVLALVRLWQLTLEAIYLLMLRINGQRQARATALLAMFSSFRQTLED